MRSIFFYLSFPAFRMEFNPVNCVIFKGDLKKKLVQHDYIEKLA